MAIARDRYTSVMSALSEALRDLEGEAEPGRVTEAAVRGFRALPAVLGLHPQRVEQVLSFAAAALERSADQRLRRAALQAALQASSAARLRSERERRALSLREAAVRVGLHFGSYAPLETGRTYPRGAALLDRIGSAYDLPEGWEQELSARVARELAKRHTTRRRSSAWHAALSRDTEAVVAEWRAAIDRRWGPRGSPPER